MSQKSEGPRARFVISDAHDIFWSKASRFARSPRRDVTATAPLHRGGVIDADVVIVTNCTFPGGNAATTLTELRAFEAAGLSVVIVNCSIKRSRWKWNWISDRYLPVADRLVSAHRVERITCRTAIIRGPRMMMTRNFERFARKVRPEHAIFVVNNSAWNENGRPVFPWPDLHTLIGTLDWPRVELCPTGPIIRAESDRDLQGTGIASYLSDRDWPPVMDQEDFPFVPRARLDPPIVIGRHARDHPGKWLSNRDELLAVYPDTDPDIRVSILGGADTVGRQIGGIPEGWQVMPFGLDGVQDYLAELDVFVNFPSPERHEAFGRTIVEAILSGLPVILPHRFAATFGDLAFYCEPREVRGVIDRLAADDSGRLAYLEAARDLAADLYCTPSLVRRLRDGGAIPTPVLPEPAATWRRGILPQA